MSIEYASEKTVTPAELAEVFRRSGLRRPVDDLPRLGRMIEHAGLIITARDGGTLVGVARSLTDFAYACYLSDLAVDAAYQRRGVGKELVRRTREAVGDEAVVLLVSAPDAMEYYPKIGFEKMDRAFHVPRKR